MYLWVHCLLSFYNIPQFRMRDRRLNKMYIKTCMSALLNTNATLSNLLQHEFFFISPSVHKIDTAIWNWHIHHSRVQKDIISMTFNMFVFIVDTCLVVVLPWRFIFVLITCKLWQGLIDLKIIVDAQANACVSHINIRIKSHSSVNYPQIWVEIY